VNIILSPFAFRLFVYCAFLIFIPFLSNDFISDDSILDCSISGQEKNATLLYPSIPLYIEFVIYWHIFNFSNFPYIPVWIWHWRTHARILLWNVAYGNVSEVKKIGACIGQPFSQRNPFPLKSAIETIVSTRLLSNPNMEEACARGLEIRVLICSASPSSSELPAATDVD